MFAILVLQNVLNQLVVGVQNQSFSTAEHTQIHAVHAVHLHHILHSAAFLGEGNHGGDILVLHLLYFYVQLVIAESLPEDFSQRIGGLLQLCFVCSLYKVLGQIRVDPLELDLVILHFQMGNEGSVDVVLQDDSILAFLAEEIDILALLYLVGYIEDGRLFRLLLLGIRLLVVRVFYHVHISGFLLRNQILQSLILAVQILEQDIIAHLVAEFLILQAAEFDKRADVVPVLLIGFPIGLAHTGELICYLLGDVIGNLLYKAVVLQGASGYVQRQIRAVDDAL